MPTLPPILADGTDSLVKLGFWVIVLILWGLGSISSAIKKQKKEGEARRQLEQAARAADLASAARPVPPPIPGRAPQRAGQRSAPPPPPPPPPIPSQEMQRQQRRQAKKQKQKQPKGRVAAPPLPVRPAPSLSQEQAVVAAVAPRASSASAPASVHPLAVLIRKSLRTQIVVNEILQPPLALRPPQEF